MSMILQLLCGFVQNHVGSYHLSAFYLLKCYYQFLNLIYLGEELFDFYKMFHNFFRYCVGEKLMHCEIRSDTSLEAIVS